jgi:hypothetical protein
MGMCVFVGNLVSIVSIYWGISLMTGMKLTTFLCNSLSNGFSNGVSYTQVPSHFLVIMCT